MASGIALIVVLFCTDLVWAQCSMCRSALESPEAQALAGGFRRGILFLLCMPFAAVTVVSALVIRSHRKLDSNEPSE